MIKGKTKRKCKKCRTPFTPYNYGNGVAHLCKTCMTEANANNGPTKENYEQKKKTQYQEFIELREQTIKKEAITRQQKKIKKKIANWNPTRCQKCGKTLCTEEGLKIHMILRHNNG